MTHLIDFEALVRAAGKLFTVPDICLRLKELVEDPNCSTGEIARLIHTDPSLTARLLKIANSPLYYSPAEIDSVGEAIRVVGMVQLYNLALATSAAAMFQGTGGAYLSLGEFWAHSVYSGLLARMAGQDSVAHGEDTLFIAGLLHNIGKLVVLEQAAEVGASAVIPVNRRQFPWEREKEVLGFTSADVGAALLSRWNLPKRIVLPVAFQHSPLDAPDYRAEASAVHLGVRLAGHMREAGVDGEEADYLGEIHWGALEIAGLDLDALESFIPAVKEAGRDVLRIFTG